MISENVKCFGEVLWDMLPDGKVAGGAPMNVAVQLNNLGIRAEMISRVGADALGEELLGFLQQKGMTCEFIQTDPIHPTGKVNVHFDDNKDITYDIAFPAAWDFIVADAAAHRAAQSADVLVFGSLACRHAVSHASLLALLAGSRAKKIFDVNLRPPHYSRALLEALMTAADVVKMNEVELFIISEWYGGELCTDEKRMRIIRQRFGLDAVVVTLGARGAAIVTADGNYVEQQGVPVSVQDTVGSGDAFLAGLIFQLLSHATPARQLRFACGTGALVATHKGGTPTITKQAVIDLIAEKGA